MALKKSAAKKSQKNHSMEIGKAYYIRTVTFHHIGRLIAVTDTDFLLDDASWVADSGRFAQALKTGSLEDVEPFPGRAIVGRGGLIDAAEWVHPLPREVK